MSIYAFVDNNPIDALDPSGLFKLGWVNVGPVWLPSLEIFWMGFSIDLHLPRWRSKSLSAMVHQSVHLEIEPCCGVKRSKSSGRYFFRHLHTNPVGAVLEGRDPENDSKGVGVKTDGGEFTFYSGWDRQIAGSSKELYALMGGTGNSSITPPPSRGVFVVKSTFSLVEPFLDGDGAGFTSNGNLYLHEESNQHHNNWYDSSDRPTRWFAPGQAASVDVLFEWDNCEGQKWELLYGSTQDIGFSRGAFKYDHPGQVELLKEPRHE